MIALVSFCLLLGVTPADLAPTLPPVQRTVFDNGVIVCWEENHDLPLFSLNVRVRTGSVYEPADKVGLAALTGQLLETGGAADMGPDSLEQELEYRALNLSARVGADQGSVSISGRVLDLARALEIFDAVLRTPLLDSSRLEIERKRMLEDLRRENDDPGEIIGREFNYLVYGKDSPWARTPTKETLSRITRQDLLEFHRRYFVPNSMIVTIYGDFRADSLLPVLRARFGKWSSVPVDFPPVAKVEEEYGSGLYAIERDLDESYIALGHLGLRRHDPDFFAVTVLNRIMSSGVFTSRLGNEIRARRGLSYSVGGALGEGTDRGLLWISCQTKAGKTIEAVDVMKTTVAGMLKNPPTDDELRSAKETLINRFVFELDGWGKLLGRRVDLEYYGYPANYLDTYRAKIDAVTGDDILRVARAHLHPDGLKILVLGRGRDFDRPLSSLGAVTPIVLEETKE